MTRPARAVPARTATCSPGPGGLAPPSQWAGQQAGQQVGQQAVASLAPAR